MNSAAINTAFDEMIHSKGIAGTLGIPANRVYQYRSQLKNGQDISMELKLQLLRKSGWKEEAVKYSQQDIIAFAKFILKTSAKARDNGAEYLAEKWLASRKNG